MNIRIFAILGVRIFLTVFFHYFTFCANLNCIYSFKIFSSNPKHIKMSYNINTYTTLSLLLRNTTMKYYATHKLIGVLVATTLFGVSLSSFAEDKLKVPQPVAKSPAQAVQENDVSRFTNTIALINEFYVKPINEQKLLENAIRGIVSGLDPHSEYLDENAYKTLMMETSGEFGGIGIEVTSEYDVLKVVSPIDDTPAAKAGIQPGDYVVAINNKLVSNMSLSEAVDAIHGEKGSKITLTILRKGQEKPLKLELTRDIIHIDTVKSKMLANGYGYVRISQFQDPTPELMIKAIQDLKKSSDGNLKGLVLDLRNNPGGLLESAVKIVNAFLDSKNLHEFNKTIVYTKGHLQQLQYEGKADGSDILAGLPLVVLMNDGSASASEIVAGALQDYRRAIIVGLPSFGKGSVQTVIPLDKTHAIKLTTALYYTPAGRQIQNLGIKPDVVIENLKVAGPNADALILGPIREFELKNSLKNNSAKVVPQVADIGLDVKNKNRLGPDYTDLAQKDFQLYEALKILETISMVDNHSLVKK
jgi:carboxyl-terminal processing protease